MKALLARYSHLNWALADQCMVSGINFLTAIMLARYLGLEEFGRFTLAWMVVMFVISLQGALIVSPMMSIGPKQAPGDEPAYYGAVAVQQIVFGAAVFAFVWGGATGVAALFPHWRVDGLALPLACAALAFQYHDLLRRYFFTRERGGYAFGADALRYLGQVAVLFWLFETRPMDITATLWVIAALATLASLIFLPAVGRMAWRTEVARAVIVRHWHFGKWLLGTVVMRLTSSHFFLIVAGVMLGASAVGALYAARNLMGVTHILFQGLGNVMPIRAARLFQSGGPRALKAYVLRVMIYGEAATGAFAVVMFATPEFWLGLAFGDEYVGFGILLRWWAIIYMLIFLFQPLAAGLRAIEQTRPIFLATLLSSVFAVALAYPLIGLYGTTGAVGGFAFIQLMELVVLIVAFGRKFNKGRETVATTVRSTSVVREDSS